MRDGKRVPGFSFQAHGLISLGRTVVFVAPGGPEGVALLDVCGDAPSLKLRVHPPAVATSADLSADGKTVTLTIPDIQPVMQVRVKFDVESKDGERIKSELHASIHKLAK